MDATAHLVAGAAAGGRVRYPVVALALGVGTHALLDIIPHYNYTGWRPVSGALVADAVAGLILAGLVVARSPHAASATAGAAGGILPAVERLVTGQFRDFLRRPPLNLPEFEIAPPWGVLTQLLVVVVALYVAMRQPRWGSGPTGGKTR
jgi:hypothetical protein